MPEPEKVDASSQPCATGMLHQCYKSLLNEQLQKLKKRPPVYHTQNEGSQHKPKFKTTVWVNGKSYTSPNTFQQRKLAENDACKVALLAIMLKLKNEALNLIQQDKTSCKAILVEYAVRMNIQMPKYETTGSCSLPVFRSSLVFNGVSYSGDECKSKKEAEQSAARAVVLKHLESETGNILSEIIMSKYNHPVTKDTQIMVHEAKVDKETKIPNTDPLPTTTTTPQTPCQTVTLLVPTNQSTCTPINPPVHLTQPPTNTIRIPTVLAQAPVQLPQTHVPQISTEIPATPTVSLPENHPFTDVVQPINTEASSVTVSGKKRNRKSKKNAQKRMRSESQMVMSAMFHGQLPTFSAQ